MFPTEQPLPHTFSGNPDARKPFPVLFRVAKRTDPFCTDFLLPSLDKPLDICGPPGIWEIGTDRSQLSKNRSTCAVINKFTDCGVASNDCPLMQRPTTPCSFKVLTPCDLERDPERLDVFKNRGMLVSQLDSSCLCHFAPNCGTFSRARERRIPGVMYPPIPLRSETFPEGLPNLPVHLVNRVKNDTDCANLAAEICIVRHGQGKLFTLEHPANSLAMYLRSWKTLCSLEGVIKTSGHACMFPPCKRRKLQVLIHNVPQIGLAVQRECTDPTACSRTGSEHDSFNPLVKNGRVVSYPTSEEREYPVGWCEAYAEGVCQASRRFAINSFTEVFSGPRAPLSAAIAKRFAASHPPSCPPTKASESWSNSHIVSESKEDDDRDVRKENKGGRSTTS